MPLPDFDPAGYPEQLATKVTHFKTLFASLAMPETTVFASQPRHYRMRVEFGIWHQGEALDYTMSDPENPKQKVFLTTFPPADQRICEVMPQLREYLIPRPVLRHRLFRVDFLATLSGELMITLIYHRRLGEDWLPEAQALATALNVQVIGRSRGQKIVLDREWLLESFEFRGRQLKYQQIEGSFTQPNGGINRQMLGWAYDQAAGIGGNLMELYCGNGNFTIALAPQFDQVLATEVSKTSVNAAHYNLTLNGSDNIRVVRISSDEMSAALAGTETFNRLKDIDLAPFRQGTLFVDPPRSGLDETTLALASQFEHIIYISCNQETLFANVSALLNTHEITASAVFDQFPFTHHLECGLVLRKRP